MNVSPRARFAAFVCLLVGAAFAARAAEGDLDAAFAGDGTAIVPVSAGNAQATDVVVLPDGAIVLAGHAQPGVRVALDDVAQGAVTAGLRVGGTTWCMVADAPSRDEPGRFLATDQTTLLADCGALR